jgi:hypothetical protein
LDGFELGTAKPDLGPDFATIAETQDLIAEAMTFLHQDQFFLF